MPGGVEHIHGELKEDSALYPARELLVELRRERDQYTRALEIPRIRIPAKTGLIPLFGLGPLGEGQAGDEHEEEGDE